MLTAEVTEANFVHIGDVTTVPAESANCVQRVFYAPDGSTYLTLVFLFAGGSGTTRSSIWPVGSGCYCHTFFSSGSWFLTTDSEPAHRKLRREDPTSRVLVLPEGTAPLDLYRAHVKTVTEWAAGERDTPLRHESLDRWIEREKNLFERARGVYRSRPYSWRDHLRWYLQLDAKPAGGK